MTDPHELAAEAAKAQMVATRYRKEQNLTRQAAIDNDHRKEIAVECYAGQGTLTEVYRKHYKTVITNDINPLSPAMYHMPAIRFIETIIQPMKSKIDNIDFDCYGCPAMEIQKFFEVTGNKHFPLVLSLSDGFGMWMKRNKNPDPIKMRYLIEGDLNTTRIWDKHLELVDHFIKTLAKLNGAYAMKLSGVQTKHKNYVLGSYHIV